MVYVQCCDSPFTSEEIVKGATLLKSKKAGGYDSISNEMNKSTIFIIFLGYFIQ